MYIEPDGIRAKLPRRRIDEIALKYRRLPVLIRSLAGEGQSELPLVDYMCSLRRVQNDAIYIDAATGHRETVSTNNRRTPKSCYSFSRSTAEARAAIS